MFVGAHPVPQLAPWEDPNATTDGCQCGIGVERGRLSGDPIAVHPVVGVHARHKSPPTMLDAIAQCRNEASVNPDEQPEPRVYRRKRPGDIGSAI